MKISPNIGLNIPEGSDTFDFDPFLKQNLEKIDQYLMNATNVSAEFDAVNSQLADKAKKDEIVVNVKDYGAKGDGVTDDTQAIKNAIAYACGKSQRVYTDPAEDGWRTGIPTIYFPAGRYRVTQKKALSPVGTALKGYNVRGAGFDSSYILYEYTATAGETDDYLLYNTVQGSWFAYSTVENLSIVGNRTNKFWGLYGGAGSPTAFRFNNVRFERLMEGVTIFGANQNADQFKFFQCESLAIPSGGSLFWIKSGHSQSVSHEFVQCNFQYGAGDIFRIDSGGSISVYGGSVTVSPGGCIARIKNTDGSIGTGNGKFVFQGIRPEILPTGATGNEMFDIQGKCEVVFRDITFGQLTSITNGVNLGTLTEYGNITFDNCYIPSTFLMNITTQGASSYTMGAYKATVNFINSVLENPADKIVTRTILNNGGQTGSTGNVNVVNSRLTKKQAVFDNVSIPADTFIGDEAGYTPYVRQLKLYTVSASPAFSTGLFGTSRNIEMPVGALIKRIILITGYSASSTSTTYTFKNSDGTTLFTQTFTPNTLPTSQTYIGSDIYFKTTNDTNKMISVTVTGSGSAIPGKVYIEYF